ncbi:hypothetical protein K4A83_05755 [Spirulina subsalsa FACHB-351]|uniref:Uncharacterized protein n=1 Tax=Spirulina subsalsa FACHB-351 TaxID=234711 RepID=A0ABT3L2N6_9CYAN|nr:hypothetical protein [Spirulina subsalsa]MCW6035778.1 hypothetical protein [Spirulina subsalsa FACHB-351]
MKKTTGRIGLFLLSLTLGLSGGGFLPMMAQSPPMPDEGTTASAQYLAGCLDGIVPEGMTPQDLPPDYLAAAQKFCICTLEGFVELYPEPEDFVTTVARIQETGQAPPEFVSVIQRCLPE